MVDLPKDTQKQRVGRQSVTVVTSFLQKLDVIVRHEGQDTDFGSDLELELHNDRSVSGRIVKCQVKGTAGPAFANGRTKKDVSIKAATQNYWASLPVNVICILCDLSDGSLYWQRSSATLVSTKNTTLTFTDRMRFDDDPAEFRLALDRLAETPTSSQTLSLVPACLNIYTELSTQTNAAYDRGFEVDSDVDGSVRVFYAHLERLCIFTGVDELPMPWLSWERRNAIVQGRLDSRDSGLLDGNVTSEILRYVIPFYEAALTRVVECVAAEDLTESNPPLANLLMSGALAQPVIRAAFERFRKGNPFYFDVNSTIFLGMAMEERDIEFDAHLQELMIEYYRLNT
ncbi:DUF4365 domain-containing protein [Leifsonia aquatica]|uniref:DUF4365 domain-containing protein n=1 Tax=Leifsonia aquatica TaxID=144185 RepID=UPI0028A7286B|nr:DUF4365 domain-containing protein [Leifsonia aquatica]